MLAAIDLRIEILWIAISLHYMPREATHTLVGEVYHPPGPNNSAITDHLLECVDQYSRAHIQA